MVLYLIQSFDVKPIGDKIIPTEAQMKTRFKFLVDGAYAKTYAITTGDERNPFSVTGVDKIDGILGDLARLKNAADKQRAVTQKQEIERQRCKRNIGQTMSNNSLPQVVQNLDSSESKSSSAIDDVSVINVSTITKKHKSSSHITVPMAEAALTPLRVDGVATVENFEAFCSNRCKIYVN
ncbi:LAMI_0C07954g1_1 [Lachancea mirantina]|uniref:LAMI_0C07954g1_1 n=1 Tax=Lachancea mirantina TaxID=1230905 RepID=A0A1G4J478_9SACH|nr:LAMI_0C07954g1_1 [Lachancea mirantina]